MYADNTTLSTSLNPLNKTTFNSKSTETIINVNMSKINKLLLNKSKNKYMDFHMPNTRMHTPTLKIDDVHIKRVDEFNFL